MDNYINTDCLPRWRNNTVIDWKNCNGIVLDFYFNGVSGIIKILNSINYSKVNILYNNKEFEINKQSLLSCGLSNIVETINIIPYLYDVGQILISNNRYLTIIERERKRRKDTKHKNKTVRWYRCKCNFCNTENAWINEGHLKAGRGCPVCHSKQFDENIISIPITAPWMIPYFQGGYDEAKQYTKSSSKKIYFKCPDCGEIKDKEMTINKLYMKHSIGCKCSDGISYPNKFAFNMLSQLSINFISEYSPNWIKPYRYDFYFELDNKKYIIEMDGGLGHGKRVHPKSKLTIEDTLKIDIYKENLASTNNIKLIRINCENSEIDFISNNITNSPLNKILNLNNVNWVTCHEFALKNIIKTICDFKDKNPWMNATEISKIFNLSNCTISKYLNKGVHLGWCEYNGNTKCVEVFKDDISIGVFESSKYIYDNAMEILGINISHESIKSVCRKEKEFCKGYHFEYVYKTKN